MSLLACSGCSTRYASGLERCPHCGSGDRVEEGGGSVLPTVEAVCRTGTCRFRGLARTVVLRSVAPGVLGVPACWCGACGERMEESVPKISRHGGATNKNDPDAPGEAVSADGGGGEEPSPGNSSATSSEKPQPSEKPSETDPPKPAPKTGNRSGRGRGGSSTARTAATSTEGEATGA